MNTLKKLAIRNLKLNKKRTIGTIIGILMSIALVCAVSVMAFSFRRTLIQYEINKTGYYHFQLFNLTTEDLEILKNNRDIKEIKKIYNMGIFQDKDEKIKVYSLTKNTFQDLAYKIKEGRIPDNQNEIMLSNTLADNKGYKIGDTIDFDLENSNKESVKKQYKIVGIVSKNLNHQDYLLTFDEESNNINGYITLKNPYQYKTSLAELLGVNNYKDLERDVQTKYRYIENSALLRVEAFAFADGTLNSLFTVSAIVLGIIVGTSVFCIRNSFAISYTEKIKMYGMLASIGATKKQIKKSVIFEGVVLGIIAIPLGILSGIIAISILIKLVNVLLKDDSLISSFQLEISMIPIIISIVLGMLTIYFSSVSSAKRASKVSPIEQLNNAQDMKITGKKLKVPKIILKIFKTGGKLAYKNLKRSKKKYRTTVISLTVSIFVFISMFSFLKETFNVSNHYYKEDGYNVIANNYNHQFTLEQINKIKHSAYNKRVGILYKDDDNYFEVPIQKRIKDQNDAYQDKGRIMLVALDDEEFKEYVNLLALNYDKVKDTGILCDFYKFNQQEERAYDYTAQEKINGTYKNKPLSIQLGGISQIKPSAIEKWSYQDGFLVLNKKYYSNIDFELKYLKIDSKDTKKTINELKEIDSSLYITDLDEQEKNTHNINLVIAIFLYGFIAVISLIGVTNIFNTITSNMELRQKEFAMLKSVGMNKKEFNHMINLETIFYSTKSLFYGITLGIMGSYFIHQGYTIRWEDTFLLPYEPIIISIICVFLLVFLIMNYSIKKINKQNIIETIRKDTV